MAEPGCFHRGGQGGASNQSGVAQKYSLFQYKNVFHCKVLDCLVPKTQLNTIHFYLIVVEIFVN